MVPNGTHSRVLGATLLVTYIFCGIGSFNCNKFPGFLYNLSIRSANLISAATSSLRSQLRLTKRKFSNRNQDIRNKGTFRGHAIRQSTLSQFRGGNFSSLGLVQVGLGRLSIPFSINVIQTGIRRTYSEFSKLKRHVKLRPFARLVGRRGNGTLKVFTRGRYTSNNGHRRRVFIGRLSVRSIHSYLPSGVPASGRVTSRGSHRLHRFERVRRTTYGGRRHHRSGTYRRIPLFSYRDMFSFHYDVGHIALFLSVSRGRQLPYNDQYPTFRCTLVIASNSVYLVDTFTSTEATSG